VAWVVGVQGAKLPNRAIRSGNTGSTAVARSRRPVDLDDEDDEEDAVDIDEDDEKPKSERFRDVPAVDESEAEGISDADGWESGSVASASPKKSNKQTKSITPGITTKAAKPTITPTPTTKQSKVKSKPQPREPITASTFLPSLSTGFTLGSDDEDDLPFDEDAGEIPVRKNRRGQRARQA
jgi:hypothetical protein